MMTLNLKTHAGSVVAEALRRGVAGPYRPGMTQDTSGRSRSTCDHTSETAPN